MYVVFLTGLPNKDKNKYLLSLIYLALFITIEIFFKTFYHTNQYFDGVVNDKSDEGEDDDVEIEDNADEVEDGEFVDNNLDAGTIENVTYADASYKYKMSDLDGMVLERKNEWRIMPKPDNVPLSKRREFIPQGHDVPQTQVLVEQNV